MLLQKSLNTASLHSGYGKFELVKPLAGADAQVKQVQLRLENATKEKANALQNTSSFQQVQKAQAFDMHVLDGWVVPIIIGAAIVTVVAAFISLMRKNHRIRKDYEKWGSEADKMREEDAKASLKRYIELVDKKAG